MLTILNDNHTSLLLIDDSSVSWSYFPLVLHVLFRSVSFCFGLFLARSLTSSMLESSMFVAEHRGDHRLRRYHNGAERCISCKFCEYVCPPSAISISMGIKGTGLRGTSQFIVDTSRCIFCNLCLEVCPTASIVLTDSFIMTTSSSEQLCRDKRSLLWLFLFDVTV